MFEELLASLDEARVRFVVVGGLAVVIQGFARLTADVDLVIDLDRENVLRTVDTLTARGLRPLLPVNPHDFADGAVRRNWIETRNLQVFSMRDERNPLLTVDLFAEAPIPFEELWSRADSVTLRGRPIRIASIEDLIRMKRIAGRPQDAIDIERLQEIARRRRDR
jgi:predicted nucleotidyltransferase